MFEALVHLVRLIDLLADLGDLMDVLNALIQTVLDVAQICEDFDRLFVGHEHLAHSGQGTCTHLRSEREREEREKREREERERREREKRERREREGGGGGEEAGRHGREEEMKREKHYSSPDRERARETEIGGPRLEIEICTGDERRSSRHCGHRDKHTPIRRDKHTRIHTHTHDLSPALSESLKPHPLPFLSP